MLLNHSWQILDNTSLKRLTLDWSWLVRSHTDLFAQKCHMQIFTCSNPPLCKDGSVLRNKLVFDFTIEMVVTSFSFPNSVKSNQRFASLGYLKSGAERSACIPRKLEVDNLVGNHAPQKSVCAS